MEVAVEVALEVAAEAVVTMAARRGRWLLAAGRRSCIMAVAVPLWLPPVEIAVAAPAEVTVAARACKGGPGCSRVLGHGGDRGGRHRGGYEGRHGCGCEGGRRDGRRGCLGRRGREGDGGHSPWT